MFAELITVAVLHFLSLSSVAEEEVQVRNSFRFTHWAVEVFPRTDEGSFGAQITPEYSWKWGNVSGFGFFEVRNEIDEFTNHSVSISLAQPFRFVTEWGATPDGAFGQAGPEINLALVPVIGTKGVGKIFESLSVAPLVRTFGADVRGPNEVRIVWKTRPIKLPWGLSLWSEGFHRERRHGRGSFGQPQLWVGRERIWIGAEFETTRNGTLTLYGFKMVW